MSDVDTHVAEFFEWDFQEPAWSLADMECEGGVTCHRRQDDARERIDRVSAQGQRETASTKQ